MVHGNQNKARFTKRTFLFKYALTVVTFVPMSLAGLSLLPILHSLRQNDKVGLEQSRLAQIILLNGIILRRGFAYEWFALQQYLEPSEEHFTKSILVGTEFLTELKNVGSDLREDAQFDALLSNIRSRINSDVGQLQQPHEPAAVTQFDKMLKLVRMLKTFKLTADCSHELLTHETNELRLVGQIQAEQSSDLLCLASSMLGGSLAIAITGSACYLLFLAHRLKFVMIRARSVSADSAGLQIGVDRTAGSVKPSHILTDYDELLQLSEILDDTKMRLAETNAHRQNMVRVVAHDVRTPMMSALGSLDLLRREELLSEVQLAPVRTELVASTKFVNELLVREAASNDAVTPRERYLNSVDHRMPGSNGETLPKTGEDQITTGVALVQQMTLMGRYSPRLLQKLAALVAIPIVLESAIFGWSMHALLQRYDLISRQRNLNNVVSLGADVLTREAVDTVTTCMYIISSSEQLRQQALKQLSELRVAQSNLANAVRSQNVDLKNTIVSATRGWTRQLEEALGERISLSSDKNQRAADAEISSATKLSPPQGAVEFLQSVGDMHTYDETVLPFIKDQMQSLNTLQRDLERSTRFIQYGILVALATITAVSVLLVFLIGRRLSARLATIGQNAANIPCSADDWVSQDAFDELAELDEILACANQQLMEADQSSTALILEVANRINSPLSTALCHLEKLRGDVSASNPIAVDDLNDALSDLQICLLITNDLLKIQNLHVQSLNLQKVECDINQTVEDAISLVRALAKSKHIVIQNSCDHAIVAVDRVRIIQVFTNLIANAIKFSPVNSSIEITTTVTMVSGSIVMPTTAPRNGLQICVRDNGPGIDANNLEHLFAPFQRGDEVAEGFGFGLAASKLLTEQHGGTLRAESTLGHGSKFFVWLPTDN